MSIEDRIVEYRLEEPILSILKNVSKIKIDESIFQEIKQYRVFGADNEIKFIHGPTDFDTLFDIFETIQVMKDRVCEIMLSYMGVKSDIDRLYTIAKNHLWLKNELTELKNDGQRNVVIAKVIPEIEDRQHKINLIIAASELITKNLNNTYNIAKEQSVAVQQKMYHVSLTFKDKDRS